jgi:hypothetical protein
LKGVIMQEWYLMTPNTRPNITGGFENETYSNYKDDAFAEALETDIATTVTIYDSKLANPKIMRCVVQNNTANSQLDSAKRQGLFQLNTVTDSFYVLFEDRYWLITGCPGNNGVYEKVVMELCNWILKFQSADGTILSYPCVDETTQRAGEKETVTVTLGDGVHSIKLPFDDNTVLLGADRRFFLSKHPTHPTPYQIIGDPNTTTYNYGNKGLIKLTVKQDELKSSDIDRVDLGICDYFEPTISQIPPDKEGYSTIKYSSNPEIRIGGSAKTFTFTAYDEFNNVTDIIPIWKVTTLPEFEAYIHKTETANSIKIKADDIASMLDSQIKLEVCDINDNYYSFIFIKIVSGV